MNLTTPIRAAARANPAAAAVILADHQIISYAVLDGLIDALGPRLLALGLKAGDVVGLAVTGPDEFPGLVTALALARLGIASADLEVPSHRMALYLIEGDRPPRAGVRSVRLSELWSGLQPERQSVATHDDPSAILRVMSSSGTTGKPKLAAVSHAISGARLAVAEHDSALQGPVRIIGRGLGAEGGLRSLLHAFSNGACIVLTNPSESGPAIRRHNVTGLITSPKSLQTILSHLHERAKPWPSLLVVEITGSPCPTALRERARQRLCETLRTGAGTMETGRIGSGPMTSDVIVPLQLQPGVRAETTDANGTALPPGTEGRLRYQSPGLVAGYLDAPGLSAESFRGGWYHSGDIGTVSADGWLSITGRDRDLINNGGVKVSPFVIEDALLAMPEITDAAAFGAPDRDGLEQIWAAIVGTRTLSTQEISAHCVGRLSDKSPRHIIQMRALPRTESGKIMRDPLIEFARSQQG